ncbi:MAG: hypothetical protein ABR616_15680 [Dermatophilaceae bacterium]
MSYRAHVSQDPLNRTAELRLVYEGNRQTSVATEVSEDGHIIFEDVAEGVYVEPFLRFPETAIGAIREALEEFSPPPTDADLRDALELERQRVDRVITRLLDLQDQT